MLSQKALIESTQAKTSCQKTIEDLVARNVELEQNLAKYESYDDAIFALKTQVNKRRGQLTKKIHGKILDRDLPERF